MLAVAAFAVLRRREVDGLRALALVALLVCVANPVATLSAGFRLSFAAVAVLFIAASSGFDYVMSWTIKAIQTRRAQE